jgi:translocation and assembly module TamB
MDEPADLPAEGPALRRGKVWRGVLRWVVGGLAALLLAILAAAWAIDTGPGHRFLADRIAALAPATGLRIRVGRIEGSIWTRATLRDLRLYDRQGLFLQSPSVALDWRPLDWLGNRLTIRRLSADLVVLHKLPKLGSGKQGPILPGFDIRLGSLAVRHLRLEPAVAGARRTMALSGRAEIRDGRALVAADASARPGDGARLVLDAEPDRDRFDIEVRAASPANGVLAGVLGTRRPLALAVTGDGTWSRWRGRTLYRLSGKPVVDLALTARDGTYALKGMAAPSPFLAGKMQRMSDPRIAIDGDATLADRRLTLRLAAASPALRVLAKGVLDLAQGGFDAMRIDAALDRPVALFPNMTGRDIRLAVRLDGPFRTATFDYAATATRLAFDTTGFEAVRATGRGTLSPAPVTVPIKLTAARVTGVGDVAGGILRNLAVSGALKVTAKKLTGDKLAFSSDKLGGKLDLAVDLVTGQYDVALTGQILRYFIPGIGIVDVQSELKVLPGAGGRGTVVQGRGKAAVRRFDNAFLRSLAGGLPQIDTGLVRSPDGILHFKGLTLRGPAITIAANGYRRKDGTFFLEGAGTQAQYGPFRIRLDGRIDRPRLDLVFDRPVPALGLADVSLNLLPTPDGFTYTTAGGSTLGPFTGNGAILLPPNAAATVTVADLAVTGTHGKGSLRADPGGFTGRIGLAGGGLGGTIDFLPAGEIQQIALHLNAARAQLAGAPAMSVARGRLDGTVLLDPAGVTIDGTLGARGIRRGPVALARIDADAKLRGGQGTVHARIAGAQGRGLDLSGTATIAADRITIAASGTVEGRPTALASPAVLTAQDDGWRLAPVGIRFGGGEAKIGGLFGGSAVDFDVALTRLPLGIADLVAPDLGLAGEATGRVTYAARDGAAPAGRMNLTIRGLSRSGTLRSSTPIDFGIVGLIDARGAAARAILASGGQTLGRGQARLAPLGPGDDMIARLLAAPLAAQLRYKGPAGSLWRLAGVDAVDLSGPIELATDIGGRLTDPIIRGSLRATGARLQAPATGTVVQNLDATGRFDGSRLIVDRFTGAPVGGGAVSGHATFDFAAARGFAMDIAIDAQEARLLNRDDIAATVTGPLTLRYDGVVGVIGGDLKLNRGAFRLGRAAAAEVPQLKVTEVNRDEIGPIYRPTVPWRLDLKTVARNRLAVTGLGLDSEWRADLTIAGDVDAPRITGSAELVRGGYQFAGRRFDLDRGTIRFNGESPPDPSLDITAQANLSGLNATIRVGGTGQHPEISFTSVPALPEDELLARLLFGTSITNLSAPEALQLASAVASLRTGGGGGLDPINAVRKAAGLDRLRILPADTATGQRTSVAAGKYLTRRVYVELATDGQGYSATRVEWELTRWLSLLSSISTLGRTSANVRISKDY